MEELIEFPGRQRVAGEKLYSKIMDMPVPAKRFGRCPECKTTDSKIVWGWDGIYYDLLCSNGHSWTYKFKKKERNAQAINRSASFDKDKKNILDSRPFALLAIGALTWDIPEEDLK